MWEISTWDARSKKMVGMVQQISAVKVFSDDGTLIEVHCAVHPVIV